MSKCFELYPIQMLSRKVSDGVPGPTSDEGTTLEYLDETEIEAIFDPILKPYGKFTFAYFYTINATLKRIRLGIPWAIIALDREYRLSEHFKQIRKDLKMPFSYYSAESYSPDIKPIEFPPISLIFVYNKDDFRSVAQQSIMLASAWEILTDKAEHKYWLCFQDTLPVEWVSTHKDKSEERLQT